MRGCRAGNRFLVTAAVAAEAKDGITTMLSHWMRSVPPTLHPTAIMMRLRAAWGRRRRGGTVQRPIRGQLLLVVDAEEVHAGGEGGVERGRGREGEGEREREGVRER